MLTRMRARWFLYLSVLETEIIEAKLNFILESLTFKYTRQPELLSLIPDRLTEFNLRLASTVRVLNSSDMDNQDGKWSRKQDDNNASSVNNKRKFFKDVYEDSNRTKDLSKVLDSVLHAINKPESIPKDNRNNSSKKKTEEGSKPSSTTCFDSAGNKPLTPANYREKTNKDNRQRGAQGSENSSNSLRKAAYGTQKHSEKRSSSPYKTDFSAKKEEIENEESLGYSIQKHVAISGVEVAKRSKYQLIASVLYLVNFWLRKVNRRTELFADGKVDGRQTEQ